MASKRSRPAGRLLAALAGPAVLLMAGCSDHEDGTGRTGPDGSEIAQTGMYNGQETHGEGAGTVAERERDEAAVPMEKRSQQ